MNPSPDEQRLFNQALANFGGPAFMRRARAVEDVWQRLLDSCRAHRLELAGMVTCRLGILAALTGDWDNLSQAVPEANVSALRTLQEELQPKPRLALTPTTVPHVLRRAWEDLAASVVRFNRRWLAYLQTLNLEPVTAAREGYNRYYVLEKECAFTSARLARRDFKPLPPVTWQDVLAALPLLDLAGRPP